MSQSKMRASELKKKLEMTKKQLSTWSDRTEQWQSLMVNATKESTKTYYRKQYAQAMHHRDTAAANVDKLEKQLKEQRLTGSGNLQRMK